MKICFEGPSGIGKTTLSTLLESEYLVIPEVNQLFKEEKNESGDWYYKKQVERFQLSKKSNQAIFDGDIFQPLWYNWTYNYPSDYYPIEKVYEFYIKEIRKKNILFPDLYILFHTSEEKLRKRKEGDKTRRRKNFEKHLKLTKSQPKYFGFMKAQFPDLVKFIDFDNLDKTKDAVKKAIEDRKNGEKYNSEIILEEIVKWLSVNSQHK